MTNKERRDAEMAYISDESVFEEQKECRKILQKLNFMDRSDFDGIGAVVAELFGKSDNAFVNPPFYCDYGKHIEAGNPCKVIRKITDADAKKLFHDEEIDEEAWEDIRMRMGFCFE